MFNSFHVISEETGNTLSSHDSICLAVICGGFLTQSYCNVRIQCGNEIIMRMDKTGITWIDDDSKLNSLRNNVNYYLKSIKI